VDPDFRVHGYSNLYVCDASVFPSSVTVNPQLTVMALADYAAPRIAA
jgi:choline dehydrogenase-like flavoprotein